MNRSNNHLSKLLIVLLLTMGATKMAFAQSLFDEDTPIKLVLEADLSALKNDVSTDPEYITGRLIQNLPNYKINAFDVKVKARGRTRRLSGLCDFPPLKLNFKKSQIANTVFEGNDKLKVVLQCREDKDYNNYLFEEYLVYKTYNVLTEESYRVRLIQLTIKDTGYALPDMTMDGFVIEDDDTFAKRIGARQYEKTVHHQDSIDAASFDKMAMFQYMIGNTDWYINTRHNIDIFQRKADGHLIAVPYDFDFAGVINTTYATTSKEIPITRVTDRYFKGSCRNQDTMMATINEFNEKKALIFGLYENFDYLPDAIARKDLRFISKFYKIINDGEQVQTTLAVCNRPAFSARRE